jgi:hypothetical protein
VIVIGVVVAGFLAALLFGLFTGRIAWRQQGCCCPADPADDTRMRDDGTIRTPDLHGRQPS